jgi:hypothetical protein
MCSDSLFASRMEVVKHLLASEIFLVLYGLHDAAAVLSWPMRRKMFSSFLKNYTVRQENLWTSPPH